MAILEKDLQTFSENIEDGMAKMLSDAGVLKKPIELSVLLRTLIRHYASGIDRDAALPTDPTNYIYAFEEGVICTVTVFYAAMRTLCRKLLADIDRNGETVSLRLRARMPVANMCTKDAKTHFSELTNIKNVLLRKLMYIAHASNISVSIGFDDKICEVSLSFIRFRSLPTAAYSCSDDVVAASVKRAMQFLY